MSESGRYMQLFTDQRRVCRDASRNRRHPPIRGGAHPRPCPAAGGVCTTTWVETEGAVDGQNFVTEYHDAWLKNR